MAQTSAEIQKEYNEVLKVSQSLTGALNAMVDDTAKSQKNLSDRAKEYNTNLKSVFSSAQDIESTEEAILAAEKLKGELAERYWGANKKLLPTKEAEAEVGIDILKTEKKRLQVVKQVDDSQQKLTDSINGSLDGLLSGLEEIPVIGKAMSGLASGPVNYLKSSVSDAGKTFTNSFSAATKNGMSGMKAFASAGSASMSSLAASLAGPQAIIAVIVAIAAAGIIAFYKVSAAAKSFRKETGLLNSQTGDLESKFANVASSTAEFGGNIEQASSAASTFSNQMKGTQQASEAVLSSMVAMENSFGVSIDAQAKVNEQFQLMSGVSADTAQSMIQTVIAAADVAKVSPAAVMQDMAENAEAGMMFFQGSAKALALAAIEARKMGTSIGETTKVAEGLLDFESSITKELELGAMLGTRVNFNKARALAFEGDMIGMQQAVNKEVGKLGDINKMNMYQKKALTEATGMDLKSLIKQQSIAKKFGSIDKEKLAAANALLDRGMKINDISDEQLTKEAIRLGKQQEMQSEMDTLKNTFSALGVQIADAFTPMVGPILQAATLVGKLLLPIFKVLGSVIKFALAPFTLFIDGLKQAQSLIMGNKKAFVAISGVMGGILGYQIAINAQNIIGAATTAKTYLVEKGKAALGKVELALEYAKNAAQSIGTGILTAANVIKKKGLLTVIAEMAMRAFSSLSAIPVIGPVLGIAGAAAAAALGYSYFSKAGDVNSPSDGKTRISTKEGGLFELSPNDDLLAAPGLSNAMANKSDGKSGFGDMIGGLFGGDTKDADIATKLDELIIVMKANKDIFMDGKKVTAGVSSTVDKIGSNSYSIV